jgi:SecD/SecF fusion protein
MKKIFFLLMSVSCMMVLISCHSGHIGNNYMNMKLIAEGKTEKDGMERAAKIISDRIIAYGVPAENFSINIKGNEININIIHLDSNFKSLKYLATVTGNLEFWETCENKEVFTYIEDANKRLSLILKEDSTANNKIALKDNKTSEKVYEEYAKKNPLFAYLRPAIDQKDGKSFYSKGPVVGYCDIKDTARVNQMFAIDKIRELFPNNIMFMWDAKPFDEKKTTLRLYAIHLTNHRGEAPLTGSCITDAFQTSGQNNTTEISISMTSEGAKIWKRLTADNIGKCIALALDNYIYSAPTVQGEIPNGHSQITGNFTVEEAKDLANVLKFGKLPYHLKISEIKCGAEK